VALLASAWLQPAAAQSTAADAAFQRQFGDAFFDEFWSLNPGYGIGVGYYKYADKVIVPDESSRKRDLAALDRWQSRLRRIDRDALSPHTRADWMILNAEFESARWHLNDERSWQWDPSEYNVAEPIAKLLSTTYAPLEQRLSAILKRLAHVPAYYAAAKANIQSPTREHTQLAIDQNRGALAVFDDLQARLADAKLSQSERNSFDSRIKAARAAIDDYVGWLQALDKQLAQGGARSFRLGRDLYDRKFAYNIQTGVTAQELYQRAQREKERLHARMDVLAEQLWAKYFPNVAQPDDRLEKIGRLISKLSEQHVARDRFMSEVERQIPELAQWVTDHKLLSLDPDKPLKVRPTPAHQRGIAIASIDSPGPYDPLAPTYYNVLPLDDFSNERAESLLREYNRWMLPILNIHEAIPGHYAQLVYGNKSPSRIKAIFGNGAMVEGWAVYGERMMLESGYGDHTAEMWLIYSKWLLRSVCNTILDYSVHALDMSEAQAKDLLVREAFQSNEEATGKWRRVQLTSVQLTSYFAGYAAIYDFRESQKRKLGSEFDLKNFHDKFLSFGNAPVTVIKDLMQTETR
jgi:uncharacterized protein (DUF885 family)